MSVSEHANYLLNEYGRLQFDYAAYCKPDGEPLRNEARNNLETYIAELEAYIDQLLEVSEELRPCPFCGGEPVVEGNLVACNNLNCPTYDNYWTDPMIFTCDQWNTRPIEYALNARIAELERDKKALRGIEENLREHIDIGTLQLSVATARIAELEGFIDQLIEAGGTMAKGYRCHLYLDERQPINDWMKLEKDWKERER